MNQFSKDSKSKSPERDPKSKPMTAPLYKGKRNKIVSAIQNKRVIKRDPSSVVALFYEKTKGKRNLHASEENLNSEKIRPMTAISTSIKKMNQDRSDLKSGFDQISAIGHQKTIGQFYPSQKTVTKETNAMEIYTNSLLKPNAPLKKNHVD